MRTFKFNQLMTFVLVLTLFSCTDDGDPVTPPSNPEVLPTAAFSVDVNSLVVGQDITFTDASTNGTATITSWNWTFEGATPSTSTDKNPVVRYNGIGEFNVSLTVSSLVGPNTVSTDYAITADCATYACEKYPVVKEENIFYGVDDAHSMTIYQARSNHNVNRPAILINGGGAYEGSNLDELDELARRLSSYGFVVATAKYRNGIGNATANLMRGMVDSKAAVRYLRASAMTYGIDPNQIFVGGWSSGAYNALTHGYWQAEDVPDLLMDTVVPGFIASWEGNQGNPGVSSEISGVISLGGSLFGMDEAFEDDLWITESDVPLFAVHGELDSDVPCGTTQLPTTNWEFGACTIDARLQAVGVRSELIVISNGGHSAPRLSENIDTYLPLLVNFLTTS